MGTRLPISLAGLMAVVPVESTTEFAIVVVLLSGVVKVVASPVVVVVGVMVVVPSIVTVEVIVELVFVLSVVVGSLPASVN